MTLFLMLFFLCLLINLSVCLQVCRERTKIIKKGHKGHDWLMFDDYPSPDDIYSLFRLGRRYLFQDPEFMKSREHKAFIRGDKVFISESLDSSPSPATVIGQILNSEKSAVVGYTVQRDSSELPIYVPKYKIWPTEIYAKCLNAASQKTIGMHMIRSDVEGINGFRHDDELTLALGCPDALHLAVNDRYSRAAAFLLCHSYMNPSVITYNSCPFSKFKSALKHKSSDYSWDRCPTPPVPFDTLLSTLPRKVLCWNFILSMHDILCGIRDSLETYQSKKSDENFLKLFFGTRFLDHPDHFSAFIDEEPHPPLIELVPESEIEDTTKCIAPLVKAKYRFRQQKSMRQETSLERLKRESAISSEIEELLTENSLIASLGSKTPVEDAPVPYEIHPSATISEQLDPEIVISEDFRKHIEDFENPKPSLTKKTAIPFVVVGTIIRDIIKGEPKKEIVSSSEVPSEKLPSRGGSSKTFSDYSVPVSALASYRSATKSEESSLAGAIFLDTKIKTHLRFNGGGGPLRILAKMAGAAKFAFARTLYQTARKWGVCVIPMTKEECMCKFIDPLVKLLDEQMTLSHPIKGDNGAFTLLLMVSGDYSASIIAESYLSGLYFTYEWKRDGKSYFNIEVGGLLGHVGALKFGSGIASAGVSVSFQVGFFWGKAKEISDYGKTLAIGWSELGQFSFSVSLLFTNPFVDQFGDDACLPEENTAVRYLFWPMSPTCIRGFSVAFTIGLSVSAIPVTIDVSTTFTATKVIRAWSVEKMREKREAKEIVDLESIMEIDQEISKLLL
eukprot:c17880_g1_i1.p1 GENE.c17880_g1_i1~~c17880_g1_i1.p1  ORF type:complete len:808 (+),score=263.42 c17880_g1_i1:63-2426(+)